MQRHGMISRFKVMVSLLALVGALSYLDLRLWSFAPEIEPIAPPAPGNAGLPSPGGSHDADLLPPPRSLAEFPQTARRPLFFANRRPVDMSQPKSPVAAAPEAALPVSLDQVQLVGIMRTGKAKARALVRAGADGQAMWLGVGDNVRGWQLKEIGDDKAIFEADGQRVQIRLYAATTAGAK